MKCKIHCGIGLALMIGTLFTMSGGKNKVFKNFKKDLTDEQKKIYKEISSERMRIYLYSTLIGIVVSYSYHTILNKNPELAGLLSCQNSIIFFVVQYLSYNVWPKSKWILDYLKSEKQIKRWVRKYSIMKSRYYIGIILGLISYYLLCYFMLKNNF